MRAGRMSSAARIWLAALKASPTPVSWKKFSATSKVMRSGSGQQAGELGITCLLLSTPCANLCAGIIESRSLGMKGTFIRVKNRSALEEVIRSLPRLRSQNEESETRF